MSIGIIGCGVVGGSLMRWLKKNTNHKLHLNDPHLGHEEDAFSQNVIFIAVPVHTDSLKQDLSILDEVISKCHNSAIIFVRSSVLPGTCDDLARKHNKYVCSMPEFLTERSCDEDMEKHINVIAGYPELNPNMQAVVFGTLGEVFQYKKKVTVRGNRECEMAKFTHNVFGAVKVTFFNAIHQVCAKNRIDYDEMLQMIFHTGFINKEHTKVPGPDGKRGFGGRCFPVNLEALMGFVGNDASYMILQNVHALNMLYRGLKEEDLPAWKEGSV